MAGTGNVGGFLNLTKAFYDEVASGPPFLNVHVSMSASPSKPAGEPALASEVVVLGPPARQSKPEPEHPDGILVCPQGDLTGNRTFQALAGSHQGIPQLSKVCVTPLCFFRETYISIYFHKPKEIQRGVSLS